MIPENKKQAVEKALVTVFGTSDYEDIQPLTAGLSTALIFKITVKSQPFLLRVVTRTDAMGDQTHHFNSVRTAANAGLAPKVWYTSIEDRVAITDFIDAKPFPIAIAKTELPGMLRKLHRLPGIPYRLDFFDFFDRIVQKFRDANVLPDAETAEVFEQYYNIRKIYVWDKDSLVSSHNDLKADNMLYDGKRAWFVDWEAIFLNDRYLDLSVVANFVATESGDDAKLLESYFDRTPSNYELARFYLMRQMLHVSYFTFLMPMAHNEVPPISNKPKESFREYHDLLWQGKINIGEAINKIHYAWIHLEQVKQNIKLPQFEESLKIMTAHHQH